MKPLISILTSAYNCEKYITTYIDKLLAMTYPKVEIIFIDDGSEDRIKEILGENTEKFQKKGYSFKYFYQKNAGQAAALNYALKKMTGQYFTILDADDFLFENCLEERVKTLEADANLGFVVSNGYNYNYPDVKKEAGQIFNEIDEKNFFEKVLKGYYVCNLAYTFRTSILKKYNPDLDISTLRAGQNLQIILPYALHCKMKYISAPLFGRVNHKDSHSQNAAVDEYERKIIRENEITQIITETLYRDQEAATWIPSVYMRGIFSKCLISIAAGEKKQFKKYKKQAIKMYLELTKQFLNGFVVIIKAKMKKYIK